MERRKGEGENRRERGGRQSADLEDVKGVVVVADLKGGAILGDPEQVCVQVAAGTQRKEGKKEERKEGGKEGRREGRKEDRRSDSQWDRHKREHEGV